MQRTSDLYKELLAGDHQEETRLSIGETGVLITNQGDRITFGAKAYNLTARGSMIQISNTNEEPLAGLCIFGKTTQDGTPTPEAPVPLESVGESVDVTVCGKNLLAYPYEAEANGGTGYGNYLGITITDNGDGSVSFSGTATATRSFRICYNHPRLFKAGNYTLNLNPTALGVVRGAIQNHISGAVIAPIYAVEGKATFTLSEDTEVRIYLAIDSGLTANLDIYPQIEIGSTATKYEPYKAQTVTLSTPNGLPGIPVTSGGNYTDEKGQQWACDEVDFARGVYIQNVQKVILDGTEKYSVTGTNQYYTDVSLVGKDADGIVYGGFGDCQRITCSHFSVQPTNVSSGSRTHGMIIAYTSSTSSCRLLFVLDGTDMKTYAAEQYAAGNPVTVFYQRANPIETALSAEELAQYAALHTNYPNTTIFNDGGAGMEVVYTMNGDGPTGVLTGATGADGGYDESVLVAMETDNNAFGGNSPQVGACVSAEIDVEMLKPFGELPPMARLVPYTRLTDGIRHSEWIQKGVFYIDTRREKEYGPDLKTIIIHGYDDMLKAEQDYPASTLAWPARDIDVVREIAAFIGVAIDPRTIPIINRGYTIQYPAGYSCRDVLGYIAAMYAGCFVMSDIGELRIVTIYGILKETRYLIDRNGQAITFGGVKILV